MLKLNSCIGLAVSISLLLLQGCLKLVSDEFPHFPEKPTVNAFLRAGDSLQVNLTFATTIDTSDIKVVDNAKIELYVDNQFVQELKYINNGNYKSTTIVEPGKEYKCIIIVPGSDTIKCRQLVPDITPVLKVEYIDSAGFDEESNVYYAFKLTFPNDKTKDNYFEIDHKNIIEKSDDNTPVTYSSKYMVAVEDPVFLNEGINRSIFSDELLQDPTYTIHYNFYRSYNRIMINDGVRTKNAYPEYIEFRSVSEDYYRYIKQLELYNQGRYSGFEGTLTAFPLYSNIENGYGIFAAYTYALTDTIYPSYAY